MKKLDQQLERLLGAAAMARPDEVGDEGAIPAAGYLLRERERQLVRTEHATRMVFRIGLTSACLLLMLTLLLNLRHFEQRDEDVFSVSQDALTRLSTP